MRTTSAILLMTALAVFAGCARQGKESAEPQTHTADAVLEAKSGSTATGTATFAEDGGQIRLHIEIDNAPPGSHAFHIHDIGDCSAPDGTSAGGHWNPTAVDHGRWLMDAHHLGDVGNMKIGDDGGAAFFLTTDLWSMGSGEANDVVGKSVILHDGSDDFVSQPTGAAGGRIACGVIELQAH